MGHIRFVVTEFGIADLPGKSMRERAHALIDIAHPDHRPDFQAFVVERKCFTTP